MTIKKLFSILTSNNPIEEITNNEERLFELIKELKEYDKEEVRIRKLIK